MTMHQIAELRRWRREKTYITGHVYNDPNDIWEDGEFTDFNLSDHPSYNISDNGSFYILVIDKTQIFKLAKDEEVK